MALQKNPHDRFPTISAFAQALERASNQYSQPMAGGYTITASTNLLLPSQQHPMQPPSQYGSAQGYANISTNLLSQSSAQPLPYPAYPLYPSQQIYSPLQVAQPLQMPKTKRMSRRVAIATLTVGVAAVAGSGLAYYAYSSSRNTSSTILKSTGSNGTYSGFQTTPTAAPTPPLMTFSDHTKTIWAVSWSPNGKYIASASDDGTSHVWSVTTHERLFSYRSQIQPAQSDDGAYAIAWMPDSTGIAVGFADGTAQLVNLTSHQTLGSYDSGTNGDLHGIIYTVSISPNGRYVAIAGFFSNDIQIFDVMTQSRVRSLSGHTDSVWSLSWSHNGRYIASGSADATARVWDWNSGKSLLIYNKQGDTVRAVSWSPDDSRIVSCGLTGPVYIWASDTGQTLFTYGNQSDFEILATAWSHNGKYIASAGGSDASTHIWNAHNGQLLTRFPSMSINSLSWSHDDTRIVTANNNVVQVWHL